MYRLMIVEDEAHIREGIKKSIPWENMGYVVDSTFKNGKEALERLRYNPIDVLLTDIKMPIMDGIELAQNARQQIPDIEIVILSGFSEFDYAKKAISFRAYDYLLKPTNKEKLIEAFTSLKEVLDLKVERKEEIFYNNMIKSVGLDQMRAEFLKSMIDGDTSVFDDFEEKSMALELEFSGNTFTVATMKFDKKLLNKHLSTSWNTDKRLLRFSYLNILKETFSTLDKAYFLVEDYDLIHFLFCFETLEEQNEVMIRTLQKTAESIHNCLFKSQEFPYSIGVGLSYPSVHHVAKSYNQARRSLQNNFYQNDSSIQVFNDGNESGFEQNYIRYYPEEISKAVNLIANGSGSSAKKCLSDMFERLNSQKLLPEIVKNYCVSFKLMVQSKIAHKIKGTNLILGEEFNDTVKEAISIKELEKYIINVAVEVADVINQSLEIQNENDHGAVIKKAKTFIENHLNEKISLSVISKHVFLSETYFSFLFKKETGSNYIDDIQNKRMEKAKDLLRSSNCKIYEIAEMIGYSEYKYFSIQFKKYVGITPKEYRKNNR